MYSLLVIAIIATLAFSEVIELDSSNFAPFIKENDVVLVEFYATWCGHCKNFAPEYEKLSEILTDVPVAKVNGPENKQISEAAQVTGFPTVMIFMNGQMLMTYDGPRSADQIANWVNKLRSDPVTAIDSVESLASNTAKYAIIGSNSNFLKELGVYFRKSGLLEAEVYDFSSGDISTLPAPGVSADSLVLLFNGEYSIIPEESSTNAGKVLSFIFNLSKPSVSRIDIPEVFFSHSRSGSPSLLVFVEGDYEGEPDKVSSEDDNLLTDEQRSILDSLPISVLYIPTKRYSDYFKGVMGENVQLPVFTLIEWEDSTPIRTWYQPSYFDEGFNLFEDVESTLKFINGALEGSISWKPKSEPIPTENPGPVFDVVADSFKDIVLDDKKDVIIEIYSPKCPHCIKLAPTYEEIAVSFADTESVIFTKLNGAANDIPEELSSSMKGFPTIVMFPAGDKANPVLYAAPERTVAAISDWVVAHATSLAESTNTAEEDVHDDL